MIASTMRKGLIVAVLHVAIVGSLGAKLLIDRATRPRVWARAAPFDPNLPIRGRYVQLRLEADAPDFPPGGDINWVPVALAATGGRLTATRDPESTKVHVGVQHRAGATVAVLLEPVAYFIPEHVADPSIRQPGEELWVEVTIPRSGGPRPIRLGVKSHGVLTPLDVE